MKRVLIPFIILILAFTACNNRRIVSETPIKTNILGVELCKTMNSKDVCDSLMLNTGEFFLSVPEKNGNIEGYRLVPWDQNFTYGGLSWTYIDVAVTNEKEVFIIYLYGSYESLKNAKQHYDSAVALFTQKYGKGTPLKKVIYSGQTT